MASANFLEDALSTDVDQSAVNAIVGSLENHLVSSTTVTSQINTFHADSNQHTNVSEAPKHNADHSTNLGNDKLKESVQFSNVLSLSHGNYITSVSNLSQSNNINVLNSSEPLKIIYSQSSQVIPNTTRITFPTQTLTNGTIALSTGQNIIQTLPSGSIVSQANKTLTMQTPLVIKQGTSTAQVGIQPGLVTVPMTVNSNMSTTMPNVMTINKQGGQNIGTIQNVAGSGQPTIIPNVQILNMRPGNPGVSTQKSVATVSPRVVIGTPQVVGTRAPAPGITLQGLQAGGQGHLLLKTENGQYQLLRVGPAPTASTLTAPQPQTIRISTVPTHPGVQTVSTSIAAGQMQMPASVAAPVVATQPPQVAQPQPPTVTTQKPSDNTKEKCRNFLANLLDLSSKEPKSVERNVRNLIQELIDAQVEAEEFCIRLERLLNASPQPCLIGFLKKSLPLLRQSLVTKELVIEGINPPAPHVAFTNIAAPSQPTIVSSNIQMMHNGLLTSGGLTTLMPSVIPVTLANSLIQNTQDITNFSPTTQFHGQQLNNQHKPVQSKPGTIAVLQNIPLQQKINVNKVGIAKVQAAATKNNFRPNNSAVLSTVLTPSSKAFKEKEKKAQSQFTQQFTDDKMAGDDDINDVAAMGGVNLAEESQRILGSTELIGTQIRSCKDEYFLPTTLLQSRIKMAAAKHGLDEPSSEVSGIISHAVQDRLKSLVEKLAVIAQHRIDSIIKTDSRYEVTQDVKSQLKFLEELDRMEKKRREDSEREILMRAAKSRSKNEDPEQAKLKAKAKEMQRAEMEEMRQREANLTALQAIGPRKKPKLDGPGGTEDTVTNGSGNSNAFMGRSQLALRSRLKRINHRDLMFLMEQERESSQLTMLYKCYLK